jgi:hypothetical protein
VAAWLALGSGAFVVLAGLTAVALLVVQRPPGGETAKKTATATAPAALAPSPAATPSPEAEQAALERSVADHVWWDKPLTADQATTLVNTMIRMDQGDVIFIGSNGKWETVAQRNHYANGKTAPLYSDEAMDALYAGPALGNPWLKIRLYREAYDKRLDRGRAWRLLKSELDTAAFRDGRR